METEVPIHDEPAMSQARTSLVPLDRCCHAHPAWLPLLKVWPAYVCYMGGANMTSQAGGGATPARPGNACLH